MLVSEISKIIRFTFSRSQGKGGQNVNKVNTKVTAHLPVGECLFLTEHQRTRLVHRLASRINKDGELVIHVQEERSQAANKEKAVERFALLIASAIRTKRKRIRTKPSAGQVEKRIRAKKAVGDKKRRRRTDDIV